ncbi:hypothetical protein OOK41_12245 [Micromonospora sp. NBC_01655]|uniref:hypothetical protein n=1 Tax=Micromonospora sp. NBC_01655 TaxID=2975983 RepID=UPI00224ED65E|nr:hypothetical protein [Micromonospora sp. NBC_01655]MCX4471072.1 hypothetical protein [Micromonospora sp. NBC_01655]
MRDSVLSTADEVLERLEEEIAFLAEGLAGVSGQLHDLTFALGGLLAGHDHEQVRNATDQVVAILGEQVRRDLTALAGLGAIRHGHPPAHDDDVTASVPALAVEALAAAPEEDEADESEAARIANLRDRLATTAEHLRRLLAFAAGRFDLARTAAERGDADRALDGLRLAREATGSAPDGYHLWARCLVELAEASPESLGDLGQRLRDVAAFRDTARSAGTGR